MHYELSVLRALLRLARRRVTADLEQLLLRVGGEASALRAALRRLEQAGLVIRTDADGARLTMSGLAVAVAAVGARRTRRATSSRRAAPARAGRHAA